MKIYITSLQQTISFSNRFRRLEMKKFSSSANHGDRQYYIISSPIQFYDYRRRKWLFFARIKYYETVKQIFIDLQKIKCYSLWSKLANKRSITAWKVSKYGVFSGPYIPSFWTKYGDI